MFGAYKRMFIFSLLCFLVSDCSILLIPFVTAAGEENKNIISYPIAAVFWIGIAAGIIFLIAACSKRRKIEAQNRSDEKFVKRSFGIGVLSFFRNAEATVCDIIFILTVVAVIVTVVLSVNSEWLIITLTALLLISFTLHCFLNGKNYLFIKQKKIIQSKENQNE